MLWFSWKPVLCVMTWITPIQSHFHNVWAESEAPKGASQDPTGPFGGKVFQEQGRSWSPGCPLLALASHEEAEGS